MINNTKLRSKTNIINLPNILTFLRIVGSITLIFTCPFTAAFYITYTLTGLTDVLDGFTARLMHSETEFGSKLDSAADLIFYSTLLFKIFPKLMEVLTPVIWTVLGIVILIRIFIYLMIFIKYKRFASIHSYLNKLTGIMVFFIAYLIAGEYALTYCWIALSVAAIATVEELLIHITSKGYTSSRKSIFIKQPKNPEDV